MKKYARNIVLIIFAAVFISRMYYSATHIIFTQDQARDAFLMNQAYQNGEIVIGYGPKASVGDFYLAPFYYQLDYFVTAITGFSPLTIQFFTTIVEFLTVLLIYRIFKYFFSQNVSIIGALIYAFSKAIFLAGTSAWNPNMIPFCTALIILSFLKSYIDKEHKYIVLATVMTSIAVHLHFQSVMLVPFIGIFFVTSLIQKRSNIKYWLIGGALSLVLMFPYFLAEQANQWKNTRAIIDFMSFSNTHYFDRVSVVDFVFTFFPDFINQILFDGSQAFINVSRVIYFLGFAMLFVKLKEKRNLWILIAFLLSIFVMLRIYKGDKNTYYLSTLYILPALLSTAIIDKLKVFKYVVIATFLVYSVINIMSIPATNGHAEVISAMNFIKSQNSSPDARFLFRNDDYINVFAYGLSEVKEVKLNTDSKQLVEVCDAEDPCCNGDEVVSCESNRAYMYSKMLKARAGYEKIASKTFGGYKVVIGKLEENVHSVGYDLYESIPESHDILIPELYEDRNWR